jgi:tRNA threonylcarbamoyladenosine biosynthesis protein TsaB
VIVLGLDTATPATVVAVLDDARPDDIAEGRHEPQHGERPGHAAQLLAIAAEQLAVAGMGFADVDRIAIGLGPGTFTGLRIGVATARALAQSSGAELVGVSTLRALALAAEVDRPAVSRPALDTAGHEPEEMSVLAVIDARRGEAFAAGWRGGREVIEPAARAPEMLVRAVREDGAAWLAVGDGALRFRADLERAGCLVPPAGSLQHGVRGRAICELGLAASAAVARDLILPDYLRLPDAVRARNQPSRR